MSENGVDRTVRFCGKCGGKIQDGTVYCVYCGAKLPEHRNQQAPKMVPTIHAPEANRTQNSTAQKQTVERSKKQKRHVSGVQIIVALVVVSLIAYIVISKYRYDHDFQKTKSVQTESEEFTDYIILSTESNSQFGDLHAGDTINLCIGNTDTTSGITSGISWSTKDPSVATVDEDGALTCIKAGSTIITATYGGEKFSRGITVRSDDSVENAKNDDNTKDDAESESTQHSVKVARQDGKVTLLHSGDTFTLIATDNGSSAIEGNVTWKSSDKTVATVSSDGVVICKGQGACTITATIADGAEGKFKITVYSGSGGTTTGLVEETKPSNGEILYQNSAYSNWINNVTVYNEASTDCCLVFKNVNTGNYVKTVYIHPFSTATFTMPSGTFSLKYSAGYKWYGYYNQMKDPDRKFYMKMDNIEFESYASWEYSLWLETSSDPYGSEDANIVEIDPEDF